MIGIVGAGITGLATSYYLEELGIDHVVLERDDRPGGVIRTRRTDDGVLECGPQRVRMAPRLRGLVEALGIDDEVIHAREGLPLYVYTRGGLREVPVDLRTFLRTDLLSWRGKLRTLAEPLTRRGRSDETVADLVRRKFGAEVYEHLVGPLLGGIYGTDPEDMLAGHGSSRLLALERKRGTLLRPALEWLIADAPDPPCSFRNGLEELPRALYEACSHRVELSSPVHRITASGSGYVLEGSTNELPVHAVVLTPPSGVSASLVRRIAPDAADRLASLHYNPLVIVHLRAHLEADCSGYQIRTQEGFATLGVTWNASLFGYGGSDYTGREGVYTSFLAGGHNPSLVHESDHHLGRIARAEFEEITEARAEVIGVCRLPRAMPAYDLSWTATDGLALPERVYLAANYLGRPGIPGRIEDAAATAQRIAGQLSSPARATATR